MTNDSDRSRATETLTDTTMLEFASVLDDYLGEEAVDNQGWPIGTLTCYWKSASGNVILLGITVNGQQSVRVVPGRPSQVDERNSCIRLEFGTDAVRSAPQFDCADELDKAFERSVYDHFHLTETEPEGGLRYFGRRS
jgi:hypothetical protein